MQQGEVTANQVAAWSESVARHVLDSARCPRCSSVLTGSDRCDSCKAMLDGKGAVEVWDASVHAAEAIRARQRLIDALPISEASRAPQATVPLELATPQVRTAPAGPSAAVSAAVAASPEQVIAHPSTGDSTAEAAGGFSVQSLLAVAGAGLFAVAAVVFTFLNPDLTDLMTRTTVVGAIAVAFLATGWLLHRRGIRFSGEAVGALGAVFVGLTAAGTASGSETLDYWTSLAIATAVSAALLLTLAYLTRIRSWLWFAVVGITIVPALFGFGGSAVLSTVVGALGTAAAGIGIHEVLRKVAGRFGTALRGETAAVSVVQISFVAIVPPLLPFVAASSETQHVLLSAAVFAVIAAVAAASTRAHLAWFWSFIAGVFATATVGILPFAVSGIGIAWFIAVVPAAVGVLVVGLASVRRTGSVRSPELVSGGIVVLVWSAIPAIMLAAIQASSPLWAGLIGVRGLDDLIATDVGLAPLMGVLAFSASAAALTVQRRRAGRGSGAPFSDVAVWTAVLAALTVAPWEALAGPAQIMVGLGLAVLFSISRVTRSIPARRSLMVVASATAAHIALIQTALISWREGPWSAVIAGALVLAVLVLVARTAPAGIHAWHVGAGYAYGLALVATALFEAGVDDVVVLNLTVSVAALAALAATLNVRVDARAWYAVLIVTSIPFLAGVAWVLVLRTGWTALSVSLIFALALTLVLTRRPGLNGLVRGVAGGLLVPSLAVVAVSLGAWLLDSSGSPVVLPVIAVITAAALTGLRLMRVSLEQRSIDRGQVASVIAFIELSTLVTAAIAVLLALVRSSAGLETAVVVLVIIGVGGAGARIYSHRPYGWWLAGASWTGALWSGWAIVGVDLVEAYVLPPALITAAIGGLLLARRKAGEALASAGLAIAVLPTLALLAVVGDGGFLAFPWRALGLMAAAAICALLAALVQRRGETSRFASLRIPLSAIAYLAAAAGPIQAVRYGLELDLIRAEDSELMAVALLLSLIAVVITLGAARVVEATGASDDADLSTVARWVRHEATLRWLTVPALVYLVAGPIAAIRRDWFAIWTLWTLMLVLLAAVLLVVVRARGHRKSLPPVWVVYAIAWVTGVAGWSERDLRVEWFSLPLGAAVLAAGVLEWRLSLRDGDDPSARRSARLADWPNGFGGSWRLLGPGIVLTVLPSVLATGTDPLTARAILVISLALAAILVGTARRLAAPFVIGLVTLPVENVIVFVVQIGDEISALPWWITLATAGAVLLSLGVRSERKTAEGGGVAARLRELR